jgi:nucleotide-binding universal stress UspA family protein
MAHCRGVPAAGSVLGSICGGDPIVLVCGREHPVVMAAEHLPEHEDAVAIGRNTGRGGMDPHRPQRPIKRLLFIADSAAADADDLPPSVRAIIDEAAELYVVPPTLPGRLAWLADDIDGFRHVADERLEMVLGHMHSIGASASGTPRRGSMLTVIADAVAEFQPDHILIALRSSEHANWQERTIIERIEARFDLPLTTYSVDPQGHTSTADGPLLLCFDGSERAARAIERAGALFAGRDALVVTVWQPPSLGSHAWSGVTASMVEFFKFDRASAEAGRRVADEGVRIAIEAGLQATPLAVEADGPVWLTILEIADRHDAATIVMGSRGLTGLRSTLLGSVSNAVVHHTDRPTLIFRQPVAG